MCTPTARLEILSRTPFFKGLQTSEIAWIGTKFHDADFKVDEVICRSGDPADQFFVVADGRVRLLQHSLSGKDVLLDLLTTGDFFGSFSGENDDFYTETGQAHSACCIQVISREGFQQILERYPTVAMKVIDIMSKRLQKANERVHQLSSLPVEGRIASILLMLGSKFGERRGTELLLQVPLTRENLAGMTATTIESTSRVMSEFQKGGLIRSGRGWVALKDQESLENIAGLESDSARFSI